MATAVNCGSTLCPPTSVHPEARFRGDLPSIVESHSILHRSPASIWQDGLYLGNGDLAATVHGEPQRTRVLLNKGDIWDERTQWQDDEYDPAEFDWQGTKMAVTRGVETGDWSEFDNLPKPTARVPEGAVQNYSGFQPAGYLDIIGDLPDGYSEFQQKLSFYRAHVDCSFRSGDNYFAFGAYTHADHNLLAINIATDDPAAWPLSLQLHRDLVPFRIPHKLDPYLASPEFGHDDDSMWMTLVLPDGFAFAVVARLAGQTLDFERNDDRVTGHIAAPSSNRLSLHLTIVTGQDAPPAALAQQGKEDLTAITADHRALLTSHRHWWAEFWARGWISLPEKLVENLWYAEIYKMASCSRKGGQAPGQLGHWSGFPDPPWRGDYHTNINIQETYWAIYPANRPELGWPFYDLYLDILDFVIEDTARFTGQPGARFVRGHGRSGRPQKRGNDWELWPGGGAWLCAHFWWHYQFTRDIDFLRDCYRMFRACLDYFVAYVGEPDADGRYNIVPSICHEQSQKGLTSGPGEWGRNSPYDLGILREHLMHTITASEILGVDETEREQWRELLQNLAPFPVSSDGWLEEWEGVSLWPSHRHLSPMYPIFPGEEIHQDSDPESARIGRLTVLRFLARGSEGYTGFSFGWMAACAARMGMADEALSCLRDHVRAFVNVNGYSLLGPSRFPGLAPYMAERRGDEWHTKLPNSESGSSFCAGINEILLRSPSGNVDGRPLIRVFPAITAAWRDVRISRLRAQGAFLVTAERRDGKTAYVLIESEAGADCRLVSPWPNEPVSVESDGQPVAHEIDGNAIWFATQRGRSYLIFATTSPPRDLEMVGLEVDDDDECRLGIGGPVDALSWRGYDPGLW